MKPAILPLPFDAARLRGLSERLLQSHHQNNYAGAVKRLHAIRAELAALDWGSASGFRINGLKREELIAANSMILHEIYFDGLGGGGAPRGTLAETIARDFGGLDRWRTQFS
ncbi:MAG TPA: superoxide dismutase, partial [Burkholderiales bacterium]|nr:superoxide dismutase [Burkholderiales bacterium]